MRRLAVCADQFLSRKIDNVGETAETKSINDPEMIVRLTLFCVRPTGMSSYNDSCTGEQTHTTWCHCCSRCRR